MTSESAICCDMMRSQVELDCPDHSELSDCPDSVVARWESGSFVLRVHDGGTSGIAINYCPWCGSPL
jgi:hypothetical protein